MQTDNDLHCDQTNSGLSQNIIDTGCDHESNDGTFIFTEKSKHNCFSLEDVDRIYKRKRNDCLRIIEEKGLRFNPDIKRPDVPIDLYKAGFICYDYINTPRERVTTLKRYYQIMNFKVDGDHLSRLVEVCNTIDRKYFRQKMAEQHLDNFEEQWEYYKENAAMSMPLCELFGYNVIPIEDYDKTIRIRKEYAKLFGREDNFMDD